MAVKVALEPRIHCCHPQETEKSMAVKVALEPRIHCCHPQDTEESVAVKVAVVVEVSILPLCSKNSPIYKYIVPCRDTPSQTVASKKQTMLSAQTH